MPPELSDGAQKVWRKVGSHLQKLGLVTPLDEMALVMLCESYANYLTLIIEARKTGPIIQQNGQLVPNPYLVRADREAERVRRLFAEFGLTPASRTRVEAAPASPEDELEAFLNDLPNPQDN